MRMAWRGELGLGPTFWGLAVLGGVALCAACGAVVQATDSLLLGAVGLLVVLAWQWFTAVATWRAAACFGGRPMLGMGARAAIVAINLALLWGAAVLVGIV